MNYRRQIMLGGSAALGIGLALAGAGDGSGQTWESLTLPVRLAGAGLRRLSLSGFWGNLAAWAAVLLVCALPWALLSWCRRAKMPKGGEDWLMVLAVPEIFALLWFGVNPTRLATPMAPFFPIAAGGAILSLLGAWLILKLLRGMEDCPRDRLAAMFQPLLTGGGVLLAFSAGYGELSAFLVKSQSVAQGNTGDPGGAEFTIWMLAVLAVLEGAPYLLGALTLLWGRDLAGALGERTFGEEAVDLCERTAGCCGLVVRATVLLGVFANLLQLSLFDRMRSTSFSVSLPLFPLMLSAALLLLCRCLQRGKALQDDSDSII